MLKKYRIWTGNVDTNASVVAHMQKKKKPKESVSLLKGGPGGAEDSLLKIRAGKMTDDASHSFVPGIPGSHYQPDGFTPMLLWGNPVKSVMK